MSPSRLSISGSRIEYFGALSFELLLLVIWCKRKQSRLRNTFRKRRLF